MSSEEFASYSDAQSSFGGDTSPVSSDDKAVDPRPKQKAATSVFLRSESLFLALLFAVVALLLTTFFSFASPTSPGSEPTDTGEIRQSPLSALLPYVPTIATVFHLSHSTVRLLLRPFIVIVSLVLAILAPIFLALSILFKVLVILPSRLVAELIQFLYPVYLFCGVACLFGAGIGISGRLFVEGSWSVFANDHSHGAVKKRRKKLA